jgi:hypothetical protein
MDSVDPSPTDELRSGVEKLLRGGGGESKSCDDDEKLQELQCLLSAAGHYVTCNDVSTKLTFHRRNNTISSP